MGVIVATYFRLQIGGVTLGDQFGVNVGQLEGGSRWGYSFNINVTKAGLYPARLIFENAGNVTGPMCSGLPAIPEQRF